MKNVARIDRPLVPLVIVLFVSIVLVEAFDITIIDMTGLRLLAISLATIAGILIGLVATIVTSIVRVSTTQKQFYQGKLASEHEWPKNWFETHPAVVSQLGNKTKDALHVIYRHSIIAALDDEGVFERVANTLLPLPNEWRELKTGDGNEHLEQGDIDEFEEHMDGIGAALGGIKASKDRMEVGVHLSDTLWTLGTVLLIAFILILFSSIPNPPEFIDHGASSFALTLIEIAFISVLFIILIVTRYVKTEGKEMRRTVRGLLGKSDDALQSSQ